MAPVKLLAFQAIQLYMNFMRENNIKKRENTPLHTVMGWRDGEGGGVAHQSSIEVGDSSRAHENNGAESTSLRPFIPL